MQKRFNLLLSIWLAFGAAVNAVPPLAGLNLTEPLRPAIPSVSSDGDGITHPNRMIGKRNLIPRGLLILTEFPDYRFTTGQKADFDSLANGLDYHYEGAFGSCREYFRAQSNGQYVPQFDVVGPIMLPDSAAFYGKNNTYGRDRYMADFIIDACRRADSLGVDFSQYDNDKDGQVDFVYFLYAGYGENDSGVADRIWPHNWALSSLLYYHDTHQTEYRYGGTPFMLDGKKIETYACSPEISYLTRKRNAIGTICHEFSHVLGLPDYYPTDNNTAMYPYTPGAWSLMGYGNYLNEGRTPPNYSIYDKYFMGWVRPAILNEPEDVVLPADGLSGRLVTSDGLIPANGVLCTDTVWYFENRQREGWDSYLPGEGLLVWQVVYDPTQWYNNTPNNFTTRYRLITADGSTPYTPGTTGGGCPNVPFPGSFNIDRYTPCGDYTLSNIREENDTIRFSFMAKPSVWQTDIDGWDATVLRYDTVVMDDSTFTAVVMPKEHYRLDDESCWLITMGERDLVYNTDFTYSDTLLTIPHVQGDLVIVFQAEYDPVTGMTESVVRLHEQCYNLLGQPVDGKHYRGIVIRRVENGEWKVRMYPSVK